MMKTSLCAILTIAVCVARAATTIDPANQFAYGANLGWVDWRGDTANGAVIGDYVCSGYVYSANVGWINLGSGSPTNGIRYQNLSANDCGVNQDGLGNLRGYAYGANIGWINFENTGAPKVDLVTGNLSGYAYSANCGWISLSNVAAHVRTATIFAGADTDGDGLPDAWELTYTNSLPAFTATGDADGDGMSNLAEYLAGTDPNNAADNLRITSFQRGLLATPTRLDMQWTSQPTRQYAIQYCTDLTPNIWTDFAVLPALGTSSANWLDATDQRFYRIRAFRPLTP
jgi:hypothetical protein